MKRKSIGQWTLFKGCVVLGKSNLLSLKAAKKCLKMGSSAGFCTVEGCKANRCGDSYSCCRECNPALASMLPFKDSACFPAAATSALTGQAGCTCDKKSDDKKPDDTKKRVAYEILQMKSPTEIVVWISVDITQKEFYLRLLCLNLCDGPPGQSTEELQ